jgi:hypothetical protein
MTTPTITIDPIPSETLTIPIVGTSPLIVHRFSEKSKRTMLENMQGKKKVKEARNPQTDYDEAFYRLNDGTPGFPVLAFKLATVGAARFYQTLKMTELRQFLFFRGEMSSQCGQQLARIDGEPKMREDVVRLSMASTDLRYRPEFPEWRTELIVTYVSSCLSRDSVLSLVDAGGLGVGVGEWRPEKKGDFGTYQIDPDRKVEVI